MRPHNRSRRVLSLVLVILTMLAGTASVFAQSSGRAQGTLTQSSLTVTNESQFDSTKAEAITPALQNGMVNVIVKLQADSLATYEGDIAGLPATNPSVNGKDGLDISSPESQRYLSYINGQISQVETTAKQTISGVTVLHRYNVIVGGLALRVPADQVEALSKIAGVAAVYRDEARQLNTERSPEFIGAPTTWNQLGGQGSAGEGVVVGILDSGIWPEHPSFSDPDPLGKTYVKPQYIRDGIPCQFGSSIPGDESFTCNNKLIGGYRFMAGYTAFGPPLLPGEFLSARDDNGHGTHTASTSAGNRGVEASIFGVPRGTISGIAPRASIIAYKVCGDAGCYTSDSAAAVQQAIRDGVDVINFSIGGGANPYNDIVSLAFLDAYNAGIFVAASAGNSGPGADTTDHREPWVTTVAASTADRQFVSELTLTASGGASLTVKGASVTPGLDTPTDVVFATELGGDALCTTPLPAGSATGKVVACQRGPGRVAKGFLVQQAGAVGMILYNNPPLRQGVNTDNHFIPTIHIESDEAAQFLAFMSANSGEQATISVSTSEVGQGDVVTSFSSRGGPGQTLGVSKPDVTAPGIQILAGHTPMSVDVATGPPGEYFQAIAGTSMSSPHVAGAGALLKALYPDWTPGQIKSALMTSAKTADLVKEDGVTPFTPFDAGSGRIDLNRAWNPGITISDSGEHYAGMQNELWRSNYPSLYVPSFPGRTIVQRTMQEVTGYDTGWTPSIVYPAGQPADFTVSLSILGYFILPGNAEKTFSITVEGGTIPLGEVRHADIVFNGSNGLVAHFPVTVVRRDPVSIASTVDCTPATIALGSVTNCDITFQNTTFDPAFVMVADTLPDELTLIPSSVSGGGITAPNQVATHFTLAPAAPPIITVAPGLSPAGYLPLSGFGTPAIAGMGDETIVNFTVPAFTYGGKNYTRLAVDSNGYVVVGGGDSSDNDCCSNQNLPNPIRPNNLLAPFWTDLNPGAGGAVRIDILTDGVNDWIVVEWDAVKEFGTANTASFQIWIGLAGNTPAGQDISFAYGTITGNGDGGLLTVGAENEFGNSGQTIYFNGTGTLPSSTTELVVGATPGAPGESRTLSFQARGTSVGEWLNCAEFNSNTFDGTHILCNSGEVIPATP